MNKSRVSRWFREARTASDGWNLSKTAMQTAVFWGVFLAVLPAAIVRIEQWLGWPTYASPATVVVGAVALCIASFLGLASGYTMATAGKGTPLPIDCPRRLVVAGPYAYVRNPMAIAGLSQAAAIGLALGSLGTLIYVAAGAVLWDRFVRPIEERHLCELFGDDYIAYQQSVRCWVPRASPYRG